MESYKWDVRQHEATAFQFAFRPKGPAEPCQGDRQALELPAHTRLSPTNESILGPFHFAKGPLFFLSSALVLSLVTATDLRRYVDLLVATSSSLRQVPWEDVVTGLGLALAAGGPNLAAVHAPKAIFAAASGPYSTAGNGGVRRSTLIWHESLKRVEVRGGTSRVEGRGMEREVPPGGTLCKYRRRVGARRLAIGDSLTFVLAPSQRIHEIHRWALRNHHGNHCSPPPSPPTARRATLVCPAEAHRFVSCANVSWTRCHQLPPNTTVSSC